MQPRNLFLPGMIFILLFMVGCQQLITVEATPMPSIPPEDTPSPTFTVPPYSTNTPTNIPTLAVNDAQTKLLGLLANNGNCRFPCLWNMVPGKSASQDAQTIFLSLGSIANPMMSGVDINGGTILTTYLDGEIETNIVASYNSDDQIVSSIYFQAQGFIKSQSGNELVIKPVYDSAIFGDRLRFYMLPNMLSELGIPSAVLISTDGGQERDKDVPGFYILLFYPDQGVLVSYTTSRQVVDGKIRGCPANAHVELWIFPAGHGDSFSQFLSQTQWASLWPIPADGPAWKPIEKATSITLEQFYEAFRRSTDTCIDSPVELWPTPDSGGG